MTSTSTNTVIHRTKSSMRLSSVVPATVTVDQKMAGRIRRSENGWPFIKCNDSGVRIVEARCDETVDEWLAMALGDDHDSSFDVLAYNQALGDPNGGDMADEKWRE
ncbi:hypothetical protein ACLB2K_062438 [Fragaria x ananassa]